MGHERSLTFLKYNREGDLLFTCSKDHIPTVWRSDTGDRLGTYDGHNGTVWSLDVTRDSKLLLTASADQSVKLWDVQTGRELFSFTHTGSVRCVSWAEGEHEFASITDPFGSLPASINVFTFADEKDKQSSEARLVIIDKEAPKQKVTRVAWLPLNAALLASYDNGMLRKLDPTTGATLGEWREHVGAISSFCLNDEKTILLTSSHDRTAKLWDVATMTVLKTYTADIPLNSAAISPVKEHVIIGGGQEAMAVTTTAASAGKFETRFHHLVLESELGRIKGHFGPINALAFHPDGRSFASGGEDGYIRLHHMEADYDALGTEDALEDPALGASLADGTYERLQEEEEAARKKQEEQAAAVAAAQASGSAEVAASKAAAASARAAAEKSAPSKSILPAEILNRGH